MGGATGTLTAEMVLETLNQDHIDRLKADILKAEFDIVEV